MFYYGAAYYAEHYTPERWRRDAELMQQANCNLARLGEFAWYFMEPQADHFEFGWLDEAIEILNAHGVLVVLGTPTAGPPTWIVNARDGQPDCRQLFEDGTRWEAGTRNICCVNHPFFIERSRRIAAALGERYASHPGVIGFQIDNEPGMFGTRCYCEVCLEKFRTWLQKKYGTIETLNKRLGMLFGGNSFRDFEDIPLPRLRQPMHNPGLWLDSQRFFSDSHNGYLHMQARALREGGVRQPITTNVCHMYPGGDCTDYVDLFADLDVVAWDCYPVQFATDPAPATMGLLHAIARGFKDLPRYWMLEQQAGSPSNMLADDLRRVRLWTWQSLAHGAEMILYWHWRTHRFGAEQYWRGILDHDGEVNARYQTIAQVGAEVKRLTPLLETLQRCNDIAILFDFDSCFSVSSAHPLPGIGYRAHAEQFFAAIQALGFNADAVYDGANLQRYRVVVLPLLRLIDPKLAAQLKAYVEQGGTLIASTCTATLDRDHVALDGVRPPYWLQDVLGVEQIEWGNLGAVETPTHELLDAGREGWLATHAGKGLVPVSGLPDSGLTGVYAARSWYDLLRLRGAQSLAIFSKGTILEQAPALTRHQLGQGQAFTVATVMDQRFYRDLFKLALAAPGGPVRSEEGEDVEGLEIVPCRGSADEEVYFVLNHAAKSRVLHLSGQFQEELCGETVRERFELGAYAVAILRRD